MTTLWDRHYYYSSHFPDEETSQELALLAKVAQLLSGRASEPGVTLTIFLSHFQISASCEDLKPVLVWTADLNEHN